MELRVKGAINKEIIEKESKIASWLKSKII
jgi:hypothetical protein